MYMEQRVLRSRGCEGPPFHWRQEEHTVSLWELDTLALAPWRVAALAHQLGPKPTVNQWGARTGTRIAAATA